MVMTVLEASVDSQNWAALESEFTSAVRELDDGIVQTFLVQGKKDRNLWSIITLWESQAALDLMRASGETPRGVVILRAAGAEPALTVFDVLSRSHLEAA